MTKLGPLPVAPGFRLTLQLEFATPEAAVALGRTLRQKEPPWLTPWLRRLSIPLPYISAALNYVASSIRRVLAFLSFIFACYRFGRTITTRRRLGDAWDLSIDFELAPLHPRVAWLTERILGRRAFLGLALAIPITFAASRLSIDRSQVLLFGIASVSIVAVLTYDTMALERKAFRFGPSLIIALATVLLTLRNFAALWTLAPHGFFIRNLGESHSIYLSSWNAHTVLSTILQDMAPSPDPAAHPYFYIHHPNLPARLVSIIGIHAGLDVKGEQFVALLCSGIGLAIMFLALRRMFSPLLAACATLFVALNYTVFYSNAGDLLRSQHFILFWGLLYLLAINPALASRRLNIAVGALCVTIALSDWAFFVFALSFAIVWLLYRNGLAFWRRIGTTVVGPALAALAAYLATVVVAVGPSFFWTDILVTYLGRLNDLSGQRPSLDQLVSLYKSHNVVFWTGSDMSYNLADLTNAYWVQLQGSAGPVVSQILAAICLGVLLVLPRLLRMPLPFIAMVLVSTIACWLGVAPLSLLALPVGLVALSAAAFGNPPFTSGASPTPPFTSDTSGTTPFPSGAGTPRSSSGALCTPPLDSSAPADRPLRARAREAFARLAHFPSVATPAVSPQPASGVAVMSQSSSPSPSAAFQPSAPFPISEANGASPTATAELSPSSQQNGASVALESAIHTSPSATANGASFAEDAHASSAPSQSAAAEGDANATKSEPRPPSLRTTTVALAAALPHMRSAAIFIGIVLTAVCATAAVFPDYTVEFLFITGPRPPALIAESVAFGLLLEVLIVLSRPLVAWPPRLKRPHLLPLFAVPLLLGIYAHWSRAAYNDDPPSGPPYADFLKDPVYQGATFLTSSYDGVVWSLTGGWTYMSDSDPPGAPAETIRFRHFADWPNPKYDHPQYFLCDNTKFGWWKPVGSCINVADAMQAQGYKVLERRLDFALVELEKKGQEDSPNG